MLVNHFISEQPSHKSQDFGAWLGLQSKDRAVGSFSYFEMFLLGASGDHLSFARSQEPPNSPFLAAAQLAQLV